MSDASESKQPARFARLGARLDAFEAQLRLEGGKVLDRLEKRQAEVQGLVARAKQELPEAKASLERLAQRLRTGIDELRVKFALGKAEARDAYAEQSAHIREVMDDVEKVIDKEAAGDPGSFRSNIRIQLDRLESELAALQIQLIALGQKAKTEIVAGKEELDKQLSGLRARIEEAVDTADDKLEALEKDLEARWDKLKKTVTSLFERDGENSES